ncbi:heme oxygenase (biliverdin-producing) [Janibacter alittae]|uniref:Biliverdin-producing heme oxygenase n=1 Tax=Janibacter alittae TaxID=3115209 RepID=A0ABZ2MEN8_9MICO
MDTPLSVALRTETATAHADAEGSAFVEQLMGGQACRPAFVALAAQQMVIYRALEEVLWGHYASHPLLAPVLDHRLDRVFALEQDLVHLAGEDVQVRLATGALPIVPAAADYAMRLRTEHTPEMMLANHYVRYLGDLSGGQVIARMVQRHYEVDPAGLAFYRFTRIPRPKPYKDAYRAALDALEIDDDTHRRIVAAAVDSFELNRRVFADLAAARAPEHAAAGGPA